MSISFTYSSLVSAIQDFIEDDGAEFLAALDTIIPLGESRILREFKLDHFVKDLTGSMTAGSAFITKPTDLFALESLYYIVSEEYFFLEPKSREYLRDYWPAAATTTAKPRYYTDYSDTQWRIAGTPNSSTIKWGASYVYRPEGLSATNTTTWIGTHLGDCLLYACLIEAEQYAKADNRVAVWEAEYQRAQSASGYDLRESFRNTYALPARSKG